MIRTATGSAGELVDAFGREPSTEVHIDAVAWNLSVATARRQELIAGSLTRRDVADRLDVSRQAVSDMVDRGALIGIKEGREWRIPAWRIDDESPRGVLPGVQGLASRFPGSIVAMSRWVTRENPDLDGLTPRAALKRGNTEGVLRLVDAI